MAEGRLSRWSRLKQKGGADEREEKRAAEDRAREAEAHTAAPAAIRLPGGAKVRNFVPAMPPLAPDPEDDDDRFSRGVGHVQGDEAAAHEDALAVIAEEEIDERDLTDEEKAVVAQLPPIESLTQDSDFTPFLRDGVPEFLKRKALRALWMADPLFNFRDGLNDYDQDFNVIHKIIDGLTGNYKVGRGHLSDSELRDMTPENTRRAFGEDAVEEEDSDAEETEVAALTTDESDNDEDEDDVGNGDDDPHS